MKRGYFFLPVLLLLLAQSVAACSKDENGTEEQPQWITVAVELPRLQYHIFHSDAVGGNVSFHIYLPDSYHADDIRRFPVLYYLHGSGEGTLGIPFLTNFFNQLIAAGDIEPMLVVFPNGLPDGMWCNSKDGTRPVETMLIAELLPLVDDMFRTTGTREDRLIEGFSMGGYGAGRLGLKYSNHFAGFSMLGAGPLQLDFLEAGPYVPLAKRQTIFRTVYGNDIDYFEAQSPWRIAESVAGSLPEEMAVRMVVGTLDGMLANNIALSAHFTALGIEHQFIQVPDVGHTAPLLMQAVRNESILFYNLLFRR